MDKPIPEAMVDALYDELFRVGRYLHAPVPIDPKEIIRRHLTAAQQQGGGECSHEAWEENGGWCKCVDCGHGWSARTTPPSAPVGVDDGINVPAAKALIKIVGPGFKVIYRDAFRWKDASGDVLPNHYEMFSAETLARDFGYDLVLDLGYAAILRDPSALAQQPAAVVGEEIMVNAAHDVYTLPLQPSGLSSGPRFVVHVPEPEARGAVEFDGTDREVLREFIRICREHKPVGPWPGERVCKAIERAMDNEKPFRFIAEADMAPEREPSMKDADRMLSGPRRRRAQQPAAVDGAAVERANSWNERVSVCRDHVADIVDGPCVICALDAAEARADKLTEALRGWWKTRRPIGWTEDQHRSCPHVNLATDAEKALATALLRDQEEGHE